LSSQSIPETLILLFQVQSSVLEAALALHWQQPWARHYDITPPPPYLATRSCLLPPHSIPSPCRPSTSTPSLEIVNLFRQLLPIPRKRLLKASVGLITRSIVETRGNSDHPFTYSHPNPRS